MDKLKLAIIIGSVRPNRFAKRAANWIENLARQSSEFAVEVLDLKDYPLPFFEEEISPLFGPSSGDAAKRWQAKIAEFDAYIMTAAEYNHGPTAILKNAIDHAYQEWNNKPVSFVGYGSVGGARAVEQLRLHAVEVQMAPIRAAVHIQMPTFLELLIDGREIHEFDFLNQSATEMLDQLAWWADALRIPRSSLAA